MSRAVVSFWAPEDRHVDASGRAARPRFLPCPRDLRLLPSLMTTSDSGDPLRFCLDRLSYAVRCPTDRPITLCAVIQVWMSGLDVRFGCNASLRASCLAHRTPRRRLEANRTRRCRDDAVRVAASGNGCRGLSRRHIKDETSEATDGVVRCVGTRDAAAPFWRNMANLPQCCRATPSSAGPLRHASLTTPISFAVRNVCRIRRCSDIGVFAGTTYQC